MDSDDHLNYCVNCSSHLSKYVNNKRKAKFHNLPLDSQSDPTAIKLNSIKIQSILSSIYKLNYFDDLKFIMDSYGEDCSWTEDNDDLIGVCEDCFNVLQNLVKFYNQFNQLRLKNSYLSTTIYKLDHLMHRLEDLVDAEKMKLLQDDDESEEEDEDEEEFMSHEDMFHLMECQFEESDSIVSSTQIPNVSMEPQSNSNSKSKSIQNEDKLKDSRNFNQIQLKNNLEPVVRICRLKDYPIKKLVDHQDQDSSNSDSTMSSNFDKSSLAQLTTTSSSSSHEPFSMQNPKRFQTKSQSKPKSHHLLVSNTCPLCQKTFKISSNLTSHLLTHVDFVNSTTFSCPLPSCSKSYSQKPSLLSHIKRTHTTEKRHKCPAPGCSKSYFGMTEKRQHLRVHLKEDIFICEKCDVLFPTLDQLNSHKNSSHEKVVNQCPGCPDKTFGTELQLKAHLKEDHPTERLYTCPICAITCQFRRRLDEHIQACHQGDGLKCPHHCGTNSRFKTEERLKKHLETCRGHQIYYCSFCSKIFKEKYHCQVHERSHQGEAAGTRCSHEGCDKIFYDKSSMKRHLRTHLDERPFICEECGMSFKKASTLKTHFLVHVDSKNYQCPQCGKCFGREESLKKHLRIHSEEIQEYPCSSCDKVFKYPESRLVHFRTKHEPAPGIVCNVCGDNFAFKSILKRHMASAHGHKDHNCS